jgi:hypothetical protein
MRYLKMLPGQATMIERPVWIEKVVTLASEQTGFKRAEALPALPRAQSIACSFGRERSIDLGSLRAEFL